MFLSRMRFARSVKIIGALLATAALASCSTIKLAYNNLPEFTYWWLDGYVDFNGAQTPRTRDELTALLAWHRRNELPRLIALVQKAEAMAPNDVTPAQVCALADEVRARLVAVGEQAARPGTELAMSLGEAQLQTLAQKYAKNDAKFANDWVDRTPEQVHRKRYDDFLERNEDFYGPLDVEQRALMRRLTDQSLFDPKRVAAERRKRQAESIALLRQASTTAMAPNDVQRAIVAYVRRVADPAPGPWRDYQQALTQEGCSNVSIQHNAMRPAQRERAVQRLRAYRDDLRTLALQDSGAP